MTPAKFPAGGSWPVVLQLDRVRKINQFGFRHSFVPESLQHSPGDSRNARRVPISERFECVERAREPALLKHPKSIRSIRLQVLNVKHVGRPFQLHDEPPSGVEKQRWRNDHEYIWLLEEQRAEGGGKNEAGLVNDALQGRDPRGYKMPATMDRHAVDYVRPVKSAAIFRALLPRRIIRKSRHHLDVVSFAFEEFAQGHAVRRNPGKFRCIVDSPNDDTHRFSR